MRYPELYPPTPCQGSLTNTPAATPRRGSPLSTPTIPHRLLNRPDTPALVPKVGTPIGMPLLNTRRGISTPQSTSRISLQRGISPLARAELTPQHSRHADHASSDEHDDGDNDDELPPYPGIINVDSVLDQVRETLEHRRFASSHASNPSLSDSNSSQGSNTRPAANVNRGSRASCTVVDNRGCTQTRLEPNRNSLASLQSCGNSSHGHADPWVSSKVPRVTTVGGASRSIESDVWVVCYLGRKVWHKPFTLAYAHVKSCYNSRNFYFWKTLRYSQHQNKAVLNSLHLHGHTALWVFIHRLKS